ncbi:DUF4145 domain-containing protein [Pseudomonas chlororaphis]|uniref:DUF4145 domain-containing protein n=1 Tax=Pseudomonas chlororaphis TaxID=587753 RepID=UPI00130E7030|nr:DUF4145 domain-containing protein [Pseudomonas chlororaphis]
MRNDYHPPVYQARSFTCPHCNAYSSMSWEALNSAQHPLKVTMRAICQGCERYSLWVPDIAGPFAALSINYVLAYPSVSTAPAAEADMPSDIKIDYEEARQIFSQSPRAAAALLRLCVQKLCQQLLGKEGAIHQQIGELVEKGLPSRVLKAFDTIRIFGNESVHPGTVNLNDTPEVALALFGLLNMAVRHCITEEKELEAIHALTPEAKRRDL